jgi:dolichol-phosphate mannosyltransferase
VRQVGAVMARIGEPYEIVLINDGSRDGSLPVARELAREDGRVRVVSFSRNFGHEAASTAGLRFARGRAVVLIDSDLQDPPAVIEEMVARWREGFQIVYGQRSKRQEETALKKVTSWMFYRLMRRLTGVNIPPDTGDFRLMDRRVVDTFNALPERHRFVRGLIAWTGFRSTAVRFTRAPRFAGRTKYNYVKLVKLAVDSITGFTTAPLRIASVLGAGVASAALLWIGVVVIQYLRWGSAYRPGGYTFMAIAILLLGGVQIFLMGLLGEYVARTYEEAQRRPLYIVDELLGFGDTPARGGANGGLLGVPAANGRGAYGSTDPQDDPFDAEAAR